MIVSISRELGAGGLTVGEAVAKTLQAQLLDERKIISILSERLGLSETYVEATVERPRRLIEEILVDIAYANAMLARHQIYRPNDEKLIVAARGLVTEIAALGHVVLVGHGGPALLRSFARNQKLMVLLHAGREWRIAQVAERFGIDRSEARRRVERVDKARADHLQKYFGGNLYEARHYDVVLNTEFLGLENAISIACSVAKNAVARCEQGVVL